MFDWERRTQIVVLVLIGALLFGVGYKYAKTTQTKELEITSKEGEQGKADARIYVHVAGAVQKPGVYSFEEGARVNDAVTQAVALPEADLEGMNLAAVLEDGIRIEVPEKENLIAGIPEEQVFASAGKAPSSGYASAGSGKININTASAEELDTLPGIGPAYAERIISYREENGSFSNIEELQEVAGIGPKTYEKLKDLVSTF